MVWNQGNPAAGIAAKQLDNDVRTNNEALEDAFAREHEFATGGTVADQMHHKRGSARCFIQAGTPATRIDGTAFTVEDNGSLWIDTNSSPVNQFNFLSDFSGPTWTPISTEVIAVAVAVIHTWAAVQTFSEIPVFSKGLAANDAYLQGRNAAGGGNVNLIKANTSDEAELGVVTTLPDASKMATSGAPTADAQIANKKYVDDNVGSANYTPTSYAGEESITFPNGLIIKTGSIARSGTTTALAFGAAFPTAIISIVTSLKDGNTNPGSPEKVDNVTTSGCDITLGTSATGLSYNWIALGY